VETVELQLLLTDIQILIPLITDFQEPPILVAVLVLVLVVIMLPLVRPVDQAS
jgi:hypothetical protein